MEHKLKSKWVMWYHDKNNSDYSIGSYQRLWECSTIEEFARMNKHMPNITNDMFFFMREGHPPKWEDKANINGGAWKYSNSTKASPQIWLNACMALIGETMAKQPHKIIGISISPKKSSCTLRIWTNDNKYRDWKQLSTQLGIYRMNGALFESHTTQQFVRCDRGGRRRGSGKRRR